MRLRVGARNDELLLKVGVSVKASGSNSVQSVVRAFDIIGVLAESKEDVGVTQIAKLTGLSKTTTFRLLNTLINTGYVRKLNGGNSYTLGMKFLELSGSILDRHDIRNIARPYLEQLSRSTGEIVHLATLDDGEVVYVDKLDSSEHVIRIHSTIGNRSPLHCTGLGKVLLSGLSDREIDLIVKRRGLEKYTESTITDINDLKKELALIRERGYGLDNKEHEIEIRCVAAPLYGRKKGIVAAISVTAPEIYMPDERLPTLIGDIKKIAAEISELLGYVE